MCVLCIMPEGVLCVHLMCYYIVATIHMTRDRTGHMRHPRTNRRKKALALGSHGDGDGAKQHGRHEIPSPRALMSGTCGACCPPPTLWRDDSESGAGHSTAMISFLGRGLSAPNPHHSSHEDDPLTLGCEAERSAERSGLCRAAQSQWLVARC